VITPNPNKIDIPIKHKPVDNPVVKHYFTDNEIDEYNQYLHQYYQDNHIIIDADQAFAEAWAKYDEVRIN